MTSDITNAALLEHIQLLGNNVQHQKEELLEQIQMMKSDLQSQLHITKKELLEHMHAMRNDLQGQISSLGQRMVGMNGRLYNFEQIMDRGFTEAREHRQAIQEDLDATIRMVAKHDKKLTRMK